VKTFGALKKQHGDQHLAVRCCWKPKKRTQGNGGTYKKLTAACRGLTHRAIPAWCKGHLRDKARTRLCQEPRRTDIQEETSGETGRHQWNKGLRPS
jgi:hypothetical protein